MQLIRMALSLAAAVVVSQALLGSTCGVEDDCACFPCGAAVSLTVLDQDGNALNDDWVMAATHDGAPVDDEGACAPDLRLGNSCSFGTVAGVYRVVVEAPGFLPREVAARSAAASGQDCCLGACSDTAQVVVRMLPE